MESEINSRKGVKGLKGCQVELIPTPPNLYLAHWSRWTRRQVSSSQELTFIKLLSEGRAGR